MFNRALGREYVTQTPFRRGSQALIEFERENNRRIRRVTWKKRRGCWAAGNPLVHMLIVAALDTGMRRGELLDLRFDDVDWDRQLIHVRPEIAKSKKGESYRSERQVRDLLGHCSIVVTERYDRCGSTVSKQPLHRSTMDSLSRFFQVRPLRPIL